MSEIKIVESKFGRLDGQDVKRYVLKRGEEFEVALISYGASIQSMKIKDKNQKPVSVVLGLDTLEEYANRDLNPFFGATVGRVANRISNAEFKLNGETYKLDANNGKSCLHGGLQSLGRKNWASAIIENGVKFNYVSADMESNFPGEVWLECTYKLDPNANTLSIDITAITDKSTPLNLTNHSYFNLAGEDSGESIYEHELRLACDRYLDFNPSDTTVTGSVNSVEGTKYDFREYKKLGERIKKGAKWPDEGFDNYFVKTQSGNEVNLLASLKYPKNGLKLDILTNQLGGQFYTGNHLNVKKSSTGKTYEIHSGLAIEAHNYPDSVNHPSFPSCILNPDQEYTHKTVFKFLVDN